MKTKILFRTPITNKTGIGHFMRSLSLAFALKKNMNSNIKFVINKNSFALNTLKKRKFLLKLQNSTILQILMMRKPHLKKN